MEDMKTKEENQKKAKRKLRLVSGVLICTGIIIVLTILGFVFSPNSGQNNTYSVPDSYGFTGNVLSTCSVYRDISLVIEDRDNRLYGVTLKNNELISQKAFTNDMNYGEINDFGVVLAEYDNDNTKDFIYVHDKSENGYIYKFYSVRNDGTIIESAVPDFEGISKRASLKLTKSGNEYKYIIPDFYYDGYKISSEIGEHELTERSDPNLKPVSKTGKIAVNGKYNALPRKISLLKEIPEYMLNVNGYLLDAKKISCVETDLDGDKQKEYIIWFVKDDKTYVSLFDSSYNFVVNLFSGDGEKAADEVFEIADVDNDGVMEIIVIRDKILEVHRYNNGFFY